MTRDADEEHGGAGHARLGPREASVMEILWRQPDGFLSVRQVKNALGTELAYTTVMTVLSRLHDKGYVERRRDGRAWTYRATWTRSQHAARAMTAALDDSDDRTDVLFRFVEHLSAEEQSALRRRLDEEHPR